MKLFLLCIGLSLIIALPAHAQDTIKNPIPDTTAASQKAVSITDSSASDSSATDSLFIRQKSPVKDSLLRQTKPRLTDTTQNGGEFRKTDSLSFAESKAQDTIKTAGTATQQPQSHNQDSTKIVDIFEEMKKAKDQQDQSIKKEQSTGNKQQVKEQTKEQEHRDKQVDGRSNGQGSGQINQHESDSAADSAKNKILDKDAHFADSTSVQSAASNVPSKTDTNTAATTKNQQLAVAPTGSPLPAALDSTSDSTKDFIRKDTIQSIFTIAPPVVTDTTQAVNNSSAVSGQGQNKDSNSQEAQRQNQTKTQVNNQLNQLFEATADSSGKISQGQGKPDQPNQDSTIGLKPAENITSENKRDTLSHYDAQGTQMQAPAENLTGNKNNASASTDAQLPEKRTNNTTAADPADTTIRGLLEKSKADQKITQGTDQSDKALKNSDTDTVTVTDSVTDKDTGRAGTLNELTGQLVPDSTQPKNTPFTELFQPYREFDKETKISSTTSLTILQQHVDYKTSADFTTRYQRTGQKEGGFLFDVSVVKLNTEVETMGVQLKYDSNQNRDSTSTFAKPLFDIVGKKTYLQVDSTGKIMEVDNSALGRQVNSVLSGLSLSGGDFEVGSNFGLLLSKSGQAVVGQQWSDSLSHGGNKRVTTYTVQSIIDGDLLVTISGSVSQTGIINSDGAVFKTHFNGTQKGKMYVEQNTLLVKSRDITLNMKGTVDYNGQSLPASAVSKIQEKVTGN